MAKDYYKIPVLLGEKNFKDYIRFDVLTRQKKQKKPIRLFFAFYMAATLCFALQDTVEVAFVFGAIFVVAAVFIPTNFFRTLTNTINEQTKKMKLSPPREVYTIHLSSRKNGISYDYPEDKKIAGEYAWQDALGAWKTRNAIYLYVNDTQALLIPMNNPNLDYDGIWTFIKSNLPGDKLHEESKKFPYLMK